MVINATPVNDKAAEQDTRAVAGFVPQIAVHEVDVLTLGRLNANDADKSNYFEG
ncbi:hypothetical protein [Streptomyces sp. DH12]|uniref:hypothetical protein n=1 Tax=Streptomyces sp. DH12 TaxID=2857010 RepID=UPI001E431729|nr:hypothetical protein [Streptomyces sp. DH12]